MLKFATNKITKCALLILLFIFAAAPVSQAHRATVFAWVEGETVKTQSKFSGGRKAQGALIQVYDTHNNLLLEGKTDNQGKFNFKTPHKEKMKIVLVAGDGHRAEWTIHADAFSGMGSHKTSPTAVPSTETSTHANATAARSSQTAVTELSLIELQQLIEASIDKKLQPVINILVEAQSAGPNLKDIIGGIGYIIGLIGVATYFKYRNKSA